MEAYRAVARLGREVGRPTTPSTSRSPGGRQACARRWATLRREHGVNSFKHFMAYKNAIMVRRRDAGEQLPRAAGARRASPPCTPRTASSSIYLQQELLKQGITGPEGHPLSRPPEVEGEAANRVIRIAEVLGMPLYIVHVSCRRRSRPSPARAARASGSTARCWPGHLLIDDSRLSPSRLGDGRRPCDEPAVPAARSTRRRCGAACSPGNLQTTATDHCCFCADQKAMGRDDFSQDPQRHRRRRGPHGGALDPWRRHRAADAERVRRASPRPTPPRSSTSIRARARSASAPMPISWSGTRRRPAPSRPRPITRRSTSTSSRA